MLRRLSLCVLVVLVACGGDSDKPTPIGVTVTGLSGSGLVLQNNGGDDLAVTADGTFAFATPIDTGEAFAVTVKTQPTSPSQACEVAGGSGVVEHGKPVAIQVTCTTSKFTIGGTVTGLAGAGLVLQNNGGDDLTVTTDGTFAFATPVASGAAFSVTVKKQPFGPQQTCTIANAAGTVDASNVTGVTVTCATDHFTVGGTITGLEGNAVVLQNNLGDNLMLNANGTFTFPTSVASGDLYSVTVLTQPTSPWQTCVVSAGSGVVVNANITDVVITCTLNRYAIGGMVTGLTGSGLVLQNNAGDDLAVTANGTFTFTGTIASGDTFDVTVLTQPSNPWQTCTVTGGAGTVVNADVTTVMIDCTPNQYAIGGMVTGLDGSGLQLSLNGGTPLTITADGTFAFPTTVASGMMYAVTIVSQPTANWQTCAVSNGSGTVTNADITNVQVTCTTNQYPVQVMVNGLTGSGLVLQNNGSDNLSISGNGTFAFATQIASGATYSVGVLTNPTTPWQTCTVTNPTGTMANGVTLSVNCVTNTYTIGGMVSGLGGSGLVLRNNGANDLAIGNNGPFTFTTKIASGGAYAVTIGTQPGGQTCMVLNGSGTVAGANVTNVDVVCNSHNDGFGHGWADSVPVGTYNATQGVMACRVWSTAFAIDPNLCTSSGCGCGTSSCAFNTATPVNNQPRYVWFYSGTQAGQVTANCCNCAATTTWK